METFLSKIRKFATPKSAFIMLALFILNAIILGRVDQPLSNLANGEPKLDLRFGYDLATVERLFDAYGEQGRELYVWDLLVDTPFPVLGGLATILFVLVAFHNPLWQKVLVIAPITFVVTDLLENVLFMFLLRSYPSLSSELVAFSSFVTQVKRSAFYIIFAELVISGMIVIFVEAKRMISVRD
ncbi:MAG: hypothetical protein HY865_06120 [Chloroflexi bacterium]|nr:hypothetical protein [Chloroflexota bacterium]